MDGTGSDSIDLVGPLFKHFSENAGNIAFTSSGFSAFSSQTEFFLPEKNTTKGDLLEKALETDLEWTFVEKIPALKNRREVFFQYPFRGHFNWLGLVEKFIGKGKKYSATKKVEGEIYSATYKDTTFIKFKIDGEPQSTMVRSMAAISKIDAPDDSVNLYTIGLRMGRGTRVKPELEKRMAEGNKKANLLLHFGYFAQPGDDKLTDMCAELLGTLNPMAGVPSVQELELGRVKLKTLEKKHRIPVIAANLVDPKTNKSVFRRFSILEVDGLTIAVFGIVGKDQLDQVSAEQRRDWKLLDARLALKTAYKELRQQLQKKPDLSIVLLSSKTSDDVKKIAQVDIDLVLRSSDRMAFGEVETVMNFDKTDVQFRYPFIPSGTGIGVNEVVAEFRGKSLTRLTHLAIPVGDDSPADVNLVEAFRKMNSIAANKGSRVVLPEIEPIVRQDSKLKKLVWGPEVPINGNVENRKESDPAQFTDPLWMRLITSSIKSELKVDVVLSRNLRRRSTMIGPIHGWMVNQWLSNTDRIGIVDLTGVELLNLWQKTGRLPNIYAAGFESSKPRVNGRKIVPGNPYRVAVTDYVVKHPTFESIFKRKTIQWKFGESESGLAPTTDGKFVDIKTVAYNRFNKWSDKDGNFERSNISDFKRILTDNGSRLETEYRLRIQSLGINGSLFQNTSNIGTFADTRETRLATPDNFSLGGKLKADFLVDGKTLAVETGINAELARIVIDIPGQEIAPQERADDILIYSEARINAVKINVADAGMPLIPFVRLEYDSEFTATHDPSKGVDGEFPHQRLINILAGAVLYPGDVLRELRLAPIAQLDFSGDDFRTDFGVRLGYKLKWDIASSVYLESNSSMSYLIPDSDDRSSDLALRLISKNQLVAPLWRNFSVFAFADLFYAIGKTSANNDFGGSSIVGAGLKYSDIWRF